MTILVRGPDGKQRCPWCVAAPEYMAYHDDEWGRPVIDDVRLYEKLCLEGFQSGLSWLTILRKRDGFRRAFAGFDPERVARFGDADVQRCLADASIVRHRGKIESAINNAQRAIELRDEFGSIGAFMEQFRSPRAPGLGPEDEIDATTPESVAMSKTLRKRGWSFVGPTTMYAMMQSAGLVNDHLRECHVFEEIADAQ